MRTYFRSYYHVVPAVSSNNESLTFRLKRNPKLYNALKHFKSYVRKSMYIKYISIYHQGRIQGGVLGLEPLHVKKKDSKGEG